MTSHHRFMSIREKYKYQNIRRRKIIAIQEVYREGNQDSEKEKPSIIIRRKISWRGWDLEWTLNSRKSFSSWERRETEISRGKKM